MINIKDMSDCVSSKIDGTKELSKKNLKFNLKLFLNP